ncbi:MAG: class II fructose-bisphosphate aldolase [Marinilabiliales bacterium]|nr:class II fructose-bisphosphate aldolase [Marinilabiliales bacterium]
MGYDARIPGPHPKETTMPVSYKDIGLANTDDMFRRAFAGQYAVPAYNFNNMEQLQAIITACVETQLAGHPPGLERRPEVRQPDPAPLHGRGRGPHGPGDGEAKGADRPSPSPSTSTTATPSSCAKSCIDNGFSSVMIDGSHLAYDENIALTTPGRRLRPAARRLGRGRARACWPASRTTSRPSKSTYTQPERGRGLRQADRASTPWPSPSAPPTAPTSSSPSSAPATRAASSSRRPCGSTSWPRSRRSIPGFPIVLHGASSVIQEYVAHDQPVRRQDEGRGRRPRGAAAPGGPARPSARSTSTPTAAWS